MTRQSPPSTAALWARFRFSVIGPLLSAPPPRGQLRRALRRLADTIWKHPIHGRDVRLAAATIERWYYKARKEPHDPVGVLRRAVRKDAGKISLALALAERLARQHCGYPHWTYRLHYDNLAALVKADPSLGRLPSYSTIRRYMKSRGLRRRRREQAKGRPGEVRAARRRQAREIRSYEAEHVGSLWHLDFHHGSRKVLTADGRWRRPLALGILDDHSRLCCHLQWYLSETAEDLVHGLSQAIQKRGLPRALMTDNGAAMLAEEFAEGLLRLGIVHNKTLPYSAHQNGKQESFWGTLEGRLMEMLGGCELTLDFLNRATCAWMEIEYNRAVHRETGAAPVERFLNAPDVLRGSPSSDALRAAFRREVQRRQRRSDGTIPLEGVRFEIPSRLRDFQEVVVRYARWDLSRVDVVDPRSGAILAPIHPLDRQANADGRRAAIDPPDSDSDDGQDDNRASPEAPRPRPPLPPLLQQILDEYSASGAPPAYLPKPAEREKGRPS
jgi:transposase InsO family protein